MVYIKGRLILKRLTAVLSTAGILFLAALTTGCTDLESIGTFAALSSGQATFQAITTDYVKSVERQKRVRGKEQWPELDILIQERQTTNAGYLKIYQTVSEYMSVLAQLATDQTTAYDNSIDHVTGDLLSIKDRDGNSVFASNQITAAGWLAKLIASNTVHARQGNQLRRLIGASNVHFQVLVKTLEEYTDLYILTLENERIATDSYFRSRLKEAETSPLRLVAIEILQDSYEAKSDAINQKMNDAQNYKRLLQKISQGHQELYEHRDKLSSGRLSAEMKEQAREIANLYQAIKALK